jgi:recombinational DNA repair ATPase RecF
MVALKLGKLALLQKDRGETPLFLMDDFDTDLDESRAADLAGYLDQAGFQAVVATSKEAMIDRLGVRLVRYRVEGGVAETA